MYEASWVAFLSLSTNLKVFTVNLVIQFVYNPFTFSRKLLLNDLYNALCSATKHRQTTCVGRRQPDDTNSADRRVGIVNSLPNWSCGWDKTWRTRHWVRRRWQDKGGGMYVYIYIYIYIYIYMCVFSIVSIRMFLFNQNVIKVAFRTVLCHFQ